MKYDPHWKSYVESVKKFLRLHSNVKELNRIKSNLPLESIINILEYCDASSLINVSSICKLWFVLANDDKLWEGLCLKDFNIASQYFSNKTSAKELYRLSYIKFRDLFKNRRMKIYLPASISQSIFQIA